MSTRAYRDHALLVSTAQELGELREQVADLHLRVERLALLAEADTTLSSRSVERSFYGLTIETRESEHSPASKRLLRDYLAVAGQVDLSNPFQMRLCERCRHASHRHYFNGCNDCDCVGLLLDGEPARGFSTVPA
jgi:hypothetical protein